MSSVSRLVAGPLTRAAVVVLMGPVILLLAGSGELTWAAALASLRFTGPLGAVVFGGQLLLRWARPHEEVGP